MKDVQEAYRLLPGRAASDRLKPDLPRAGWLFEVPAAAGAMSVGLY